MMSEDVDMTSNQLFSRGRSNLKVRRRIPWITRNPSITFYNFNTHTDDPLAGDDPFDESPIQHTEAGNILREYTGNMMIPTDNFIASRNTITSFTSTRTGDVWYTMDEYGTVDAHININNDTGVITTYLTDSEGVRTYLSYKPYGNNFNIDYLYNEEYDIKKIFFVGEYTNFPTGSAEKIPAKRDRKYDIAIKSLLNKGIHYNCIKCRKYTGLICWRNKHICEECDETNKMIDRSHYRKRIPWKRTKENKKSDRDPIAWRYLYIDRKVTALMRLRAAILSLSHGNRIGRRHMPWTTKGRIDQPYDKFFEENDWKSMIGICRNLSVFTQSINTERKEQANG